MVILNQNNLELQQQTLGLAIDELEVSTKTMNSHLKSQLNQARHSALEELKSKQSSHLVHKIFYTVQQLFNPSLAFAVPMLIAIVFLVPIFIFNPIDQNLMLDKQDIYADIELLENEGQLDFLTDLDISEWMLAEDDS